MLSADATASMSNSAPTLTWNKTSPTLKSLRSPSVVSTYHDPARHTTNCTYARVNTQHSLGMCC